MSKYDRDIQDVYAVKQLGDAIGYGHLMAIAHELWARYLESKGLPRRGAHCVVGYPMVKEQFQAEALNDKIYTIIVGKALEADRKTENSSEKPNNCEDEPNCEECKHFNEQALTYMKQCKYYFMECRFEPKDEPQTVLEAVLDRQTDEDRRKMAESVRKAIKDEPQTCSFSDCDNFKNPDYERCIECKRKQIKLKTEQTERSSDDIHIKSSAADRSLSARTRNRNNNSDGHIVFSEVTERSE